MAFLDNLPDRLDDEQLGALEAIAVAPLPALPSTDERHFAQCLRTMAILPSRADDETTAKLRFALYFRHFGHLPAEAINFLAERATLECRFFPTPAECQAILNRWRRSDNAEAYRSRAMVAAQRERQTRFDALLKDLAAGALDQSAIDALPEKVKRIGVDRAWLWAWPNGRYTIRRDLTGLSAEEIETQRAAVAEMMASWERAA